MKARSIPSLVIQLSLGEYKKLWKLAEEEDKYVNNYLLSFRDPKTGIIVRFELAKETSLEADEIPSYRELMIRRDCVDLEIEDDSDSVVEAGGADWKTGKQWTGLSPGVGKRLVLVDGEDVLAMADVNAFPGIRAGDTFEVTWKLVLDAPAGDKDEEPKDV